MMQAAISVESNGALRPVAVCTWQDGLVIGHSDGSLTVFQGPELICSILNPRMSISALFVTENTAIVGFESGILTTYNLPSGLPISELDLGYTARGLYSKDRTVYLWGAGALLIILSLETLDVEARLGLESQPLRVTNDHGIVIVLSNGWIQRVRGQSEVDGSWSLNDNYSRIPLEDSPGTASDLDGNVITLTDGLIDVVPLGNSRWISLQRNSWTLFEYADEKFTTEFTAAAPSPFNALTPSSQTDAVLLLTDGGKIVRVENNNMQVIEPNWNPNALVGLLFRHEYAYALLDDMRLYTLESDQGLPQWSEPLLLSKIIEEEWVLTSELEFAARGPMIGPIVTSSDNVAEHRSLFAAKADISAFSVRSSQSREITLGLENGSLQVFGGGSEATYGPVAAAPVELILHSGKDIVIASGDVLIIKRESKTLSIPLGSRIRDIRVDQGMLWAKSDDGNLNAWDTATLASVKNPPAWPKNLAQGSFRSSIGLAVVAPFATLLTSPNVGVVTRTPRRETVTLEGFQIGDEPTRESYIALATLVLANEGRLPGNVLDSMRPRAMIVKLENFVVQSSTWDSHIYATGRKLLSEVWDAARIIELKQSGGTRATLILGAAYPDTNSHEWLTTEIQALLEKDWDSRLVALRVLALHPRLLPIPFQSLENISVENGVFQRYAMSLFRIDSTWFLEELHKYMLVNGKQSGKWVDLLSVGMYARYVTPEQSAFGDAVGLLVLALERTQKGNIRAQKVLADLRSTYPDKLLFNRKRQRLICISPSGAGFARAFDLATGHVTVLGTPQYPVFQLLFVDDGRVLQGNGTTGVYHWSFRASVATLFKAPDHIDPVEVAESQAQSAL